MNKQSVLILGSAQTNAYRGAVSKGIAPCCTSAMGMGGGQIAMIIELYRL